jgi:thymidylate synthase (FAD)
MIEYTSEVEVSLIHHNISDNMVAMAAWVSHDQDNEARLDDQAKVEGLINFLVRNKHLSPLEHGSLTVKSNVPLFVRSEWQRHRTQSYNEVSGRYTELLPKFWVGSKARVQKGKPGDYYFVEGTPEQTAGYLQSKKRAVESAWAEYQYRLELGIAKEQAREDLPLSLMTQFYATGNLRNWLQFLALRDEKHALEEIQAAAVQVADIVREVAPMTYKAFKEYGV